MRSDDDTTQTTPRLHALRSCPLPGPRGGWPTLRALLLVIETYGVGGSWCWPSQRTLAESLGLDRATVCRLVGKLRNAGLITTRKGPGNRVEYRVTPILGCDVEVTGGVTWGSQPESGGCDVEITGGVTPTSQGVCAGRHTESERKVKEKQDNAAALSEVQKLRLYVQQRLAQIVGVSPGRIPPARVSEIVQFINGRPTARREAAPWGGSEPLDARRMAQAALDVAEARKPAEGGQRALAMCVGSALGAIADAAPMGVYPEVYEMKPHLNGADRRVAQVQSDREAFLARAMKDKT
jgi:DNA-binding Lrp family transcriptional regulator